MDSKFDKLYNMFMEEVNSSKKTVIKESVTNVEDYKKFLRMCADIVKKAEEAGKQAFINDGVNEDTSCTMDQDLQNYNITLEQWENAVKYGWIVDSLPFAIDYTYDDCFEKVMTPEEQEQIKEFVYGDDHQFTNYFYNKFLTGDATDLEFCKQLSEELGVTDPDKEALMIDEYFKGDDMDYESVNKPISKRRVIKESARRPVKRLRRSVKK